MINAAVNSIGVIMTNEAEEKIKLAIGILTGNKVGKYICYFLNNYDFGKTEIVIDKIKFTDEKLQNEEKFKALVKEYNIDKIEKQVNIKKNDNLISILAFNKRTGDFPDGETYDYSELLVFQNQICVLQESIDYVYGKYDSYWEKKYFHDVSLKKFKNTSWMRELKEYSNTIEEYKKLKEEEIKKNKMNAVARDIEL